MIFAILGFLLALADVKAAPKQDRFTGARLGQLLAERLCARCHAIKITGTSFRADAPPFRTLKDKLTLEGVEEVLLEGMRLGHKPMPPWKFTPTQVENLVSYIKSLSDRN